MNSLDIEDAKRLLPLPELMRRRGLSGHAKKSAKCPLHEDRNNSFSVFEREGEWFWKCHAGCGAGDAIEFLAKVEGISNSAACRKFIELAGGAGDRAKPATVARKVATAPLPPIPDALIGSWREGVDYVLDRSGMIESLAEFRGWPAEFAHYVVGCGAISMPLYHNKRGWAFLVAAPAGERGSMTTCDIGYHVRLEPKPGEKASWRFSPNESEHGHSIPALPFIVGDFDAARLLIITEGQWDALTFALAARWVGDGCEWPSGIGLIGVRGVSGVDTFLLWYRRFWPYEADCLVLADADPAGSGWYSGDDSFTAKLSALCRKVAVVDCAPYKDFNELFRHESVGPDEIRQLLESHGMPLGSEAFA